MGFQLGTIGLEFGKCLRHQRFQRRAGRPGPDAGLLGDILRCPDAGNHVLALCIDQELAIKGVFACGRVPGKGDAGRGALAHVAEHHGLNVDGSSPGRRQIVQAAIRHGTRHHPGTEDRANRAPELLLRILRERLFQFFFHQRLELLDDAQPGIRIDFGIERQFIAFLVLFQNFFKLMVVEAQHHVGIHLMKRR